MPFGQETAEDRIRIQVRKDLKIGNEGRMNSKKVNWFYLTTVLIHLAMVAEIGRAHV